MENLNGIRGERCKKTCRGHGFPATGPARRRANPLVGATRKPETASLFYHVFPNLMKQTLIRNRAMKLVRLDGMAKKWRPVCDSLLISSGIGV